MQDSEVLTKAFKEHERRKGEQEGFPYTPADALAFKYYRDVSKLAQPHLVGILFYVGALISGLHTDKPVLCWHFYGVVHLPLLHRGAVIWLHWHTADCCFVLLIVNMVHPCTH